MIALRTTLLRRTAPLLLPLTTSLSTSSRLSSTLIISDPLPTPTSPLPAATLSAITAAKQLHDGPVTLLLLSATAPDVPSDVDTVILAGTDEEGPSYLAENVASAVMDAMNEEKGGFSHVVACATKFGGNFLPRVGGILGVQPVTDVVAILGEDTFVRPMYAGNILTKVKSKSTPQLISIRPPSFEKSSSPLSPPAATITSTPSPSSQTTWLSRDVSQSSRPELSSAPIVISGGRGLQNGDNFDLLYKMADRFTNAAVGASRAAVDAGYVGNDLQVGQTGKVVAPDLYVAVGISGAIQHLSGMKDSKVIVAINKDAEAPIFQVADYGLVEDLFDAVPELTEKL